MKYNTFAHVFGVILLAVFFTQGCDSEEPDDGPGEEELITRVTLTFTPATGASITAVADDPDGDGIDIAIDTLFLRTGTTYNGRITFEDAINGEDITSEVREEDDEHQVFYEFGDGLETSVTIIPADEDGNGLPVGLEFVAQVTARTPSTGTLNVVLSHFDASPKDGVTRGNESDVDLVFPVSILQAVPQ